MIWNEVRKTYPDKFVKFQIVNSHIEDNKEFVDDVIILDSYEDGKEAMKEFLRIKDGQFICSTKNEIVSIDLVKNIGIRRSV